MVFRSLQIWKFFGGGILRPAPPNKACAFGTHDNAPSPPSSLKNLAMALL